MPRAPGLLDEAMRQPGPLHGQGDGAVHQRDTEREGPEDGPRGAHHHVPLGREAVRLGKVPGADHVEGVNAVRREREPGAGLAVALRPGLEDDGLDAGLLESQGCGWAGDPASHDEDAHVGSLSVR